MYEIFFNTGQIILLHQIIYILLHMLINYMQHIQTRWTVSRTSIPRCISPHNIWISGRFFMYDIFDRHTLSAAHDHNKLLCLQNFGTSENILSYNLQECIFLVIESKPGVIETFKLWSNNTSTYMYWVLNHDSFCLVELIQLSSDKKMLWFSPFSILLYMFLLKNIYKWIHGI